MEFDEGDTHSLFTSIFEVCRLREKVGEERRHKSGMRNMWEVVVRMGSRERKVRKEEEANNLENSELLCH